jgi:hypothetical protein
MIVQLELGVRQEKVTDHMRDKYAKNRHKIEAQFFEYNCIQGETEKSQNTVLHRRR